MHDTTSVNVTRKLIVTRCKMCWKFSESHGDGLWLKIHWKCKFTCICIIISRWVTVNNVHDKRTVNRAHMSAKKSNTAKKLLTLKLEMRKTARSLMTAAGNVWGISKYLRNFREWIWTLALFWVFDFDVKIGALEFLHTTVRVSLAQIFPLVDVAHLHLRFTPQMTEGSKFSSSPS